MDEASGLDFVRLRSSYQAGTRTPSGVIRKIFETLTERGEDGVWLSLLPEDHVVGLAAALERQTAAERDALPLWGLPFGIKDNIDLEGCPTTAGCPAFAYQPAVSAVCVSRLVAAGALPIGKTNLDQFATGLVGGRVPGIRPRNPFQPDYVSGGSSSGSALAVALGQVSFALGTDTAGSGRVPAGLCNVVGIKPTKGRISARGLVPACRSADCISIMALTVHDGMEALDAAVGFDPADPYGRMPPADHGRTIGSSFRFGVPDAAGRNAVCDEAARNGFAASLDQLAALGGIRSEIDFSRFSESGALLYGPLVAERYADLGRFVEGHAGDVLAVTRQILLAGADISGAEVFRAQHRLADIAAAIRPLWDEMDCLIVPTYPRPVRFDELELDPHGPNTMLGSYTTFANLLDLACIAVPAGFRNDGLPHGITFIGPAFSETGLAALAARFQRHVDLPLGATGMRLGGHQAAR